MFDAQQTQEAALVFRTGSGKDVQAHMGSYLHGSKAHAPGSAVYEQAFTGLQISQMPQGIPGSEKGHRRGSSCGKAPALRYGGHSLSCCQHMAGETVRAKAEHALPHLYAGHACPHAFHHAGAFYAQARAGKAVFQCFFGQEVHGPHDIAEVEAHRPDPDQHFSRSRLFFGLGQPAQAFQPAGIAAFKAQGITCRSRAVLCYSLGAQHITARAVQDDLPLVRGLQKLPAAGCLLCSARAVQVNAAAVQGRHLVHEHTGRAHDSSLCGLQGTCVCQRQGLSCEHTQRGRRPAGHVPAACQLGKRAALLLRALPVEAIPMQIQPVYADDPLPGSSQSGPDLLPVRCPVRTDLPDSAAQAQVCPCPHTLHSLPFFLQVCTEGCQLWRRFCIFTDQPEGRIPFFLCMSLCHVCPCQQKDGGITGRHVCGAADVYFTEACPLQSLLPVRDGQLAWQFQTFAKALLPPAFVLAQQQIIQPVGYAFCQQQPAARVQGLAAALQGKGHIVGPVQAVGRQQDMRSGRRGLVLFRVPLHKTGLGTACEGRAQFCQRMGIPVRDGMLMPLQQRGRTAAENTMTSAHFQHMQGLPLWHGGQHALQGRTEQFMTQTVFLTFVSFIQGAVRGSGRRAFQQCACGIGQQEIDGTVCRCFGHEGTPDIGK